MKNFRNLREIDLHIGSSTVLVGPNGSGKSNLIQALRLVLDPSLPNSDRRLQREDFSESLADGDQGYDPFLSGAVIEVAVEFEGFDDNPQVLAMLGASLVETDPMAARLVYRFAPRDVEDGVAGRAAYAWRILGGPPEAEEEIGGDLRRFLRLMVLSALRDAEGDLAYWRRSPLRPLLEAAAGRLDADDLKKVAESITEANRGILELDEVKAVETAIAERTTDLVGERNALEVGLGVGPADPQRLLRTLRLFVDGEKPLSSASLGNLNVLYLALLQLALRDEVAAGELAHVVLGIEEPEAHLHPQVQRLVFSDVLRPPDGHGQSVLVTTHSPHIVSVTPPQNLVVLRRGETGTQAGVASAAGLTEAEWHDIARYLDATRGEMVFAAGVLLVEGFAEAVLLPKLASDAGIDLDKDGIMVCAIHGTHFGAYVRFLRELGIAWAVATDGDPKDGVRAGDTRARRLVEYLGLEGPPEDHGVFVGTDTFEPDLAGSSLGNAAAVASVLIQGGFGTRTEAVIEDLRDNGLGDPSEFLKVVKRFGKARLAQQLASLEVSLDAPQHIRDALAHLA